VFMRFAPAIENDAADAQPVDMAFVLLAPEDAPANYLRAVGKIAAILKSPEKRAQLRDLTDKDAVFALLTSEDA
jgi:PTS system nitrogen regulatory IIA component